MYTIQRDTSKSRLIVALNGTWDYDGSMFWEDFQEAAHYAKCARAHFDVLFDHTLKPILPQHRTEKGTIMAVWCLENGLRKSANIVPSTIMRMQLQRITDRNAQFDYFKTREEAEAWLDEVSLLNSA